MRGRIGMLCLSVITAAMAGCPIQAADFVPDPNRVAEIAAMLREKPGTFGVPIDNRQAWDELAKHEALQNNISQAERVLGEPIPPFTEEEYRSIVASGSRSRHYYFYNRRPGTLAELCMAECLEDKGRFLPRLEELIAELCAEKTWIVPVRKQESIDNLEGRRNTIDLNKAMRAWELALADQLLADRLQPATRQMIRENIERRIFVPYRDMLSGKQKADHWFTNTNNWNAVCLAGVTGAALTLIESRDERAYFAAAAEKLSLSFLEGFKPDGYCTEGLSYWNFGFGHYLALAEALWQATDGKLDLFDRPNMANIGLFGARIEIDGGVYPAFADCNTSTHPSEMILHFMSRRLQAGLDDWERGEMESASGTLYHRVLYPFANSARRVPPAETRVRALEPRTYFEDMGVLVCRPGPASTSRLGIALKGGHNAEHHNHNDVGSFTVGMGTGAPILDVGAEVYTNRTFSPQRYESRVLSSYGHSVPVVAGKLQETGREACAKVLKTDFTPLVDTFVLDLAPAYDMPELKCLERTLVYSREGKGSITITDTVEFTGPQTFGTALMTLGQCELRTPTSLVFRDGEDAVAVQIQASGEANVTSEILDENLLSGNKATRVGIDFRQPTMQGSIMVRITPEPVPGDEDGYLLRNGDFEDGANGWQIPVNGMSALSTEQPGNGDTALKIVDTSTSAGSNVLSDRMYLDPDTAYVLRGRVRSVSGGGVGIYVRLLGRRCEKLQKTSAQRQMSFLKVGTEPSGHWEPFTLRFQTTPETRYGHVWLHSLMADLAEVYVDDLTLVRADEDVPPAVGE